MHNPFLMAVFGYAIFVSLIDGFRRQQGMSVLPTHMIFFLTLPVLVCFFASLVWEHHRTYYAPHHITQSINGHVFKEYWTTNPAVVSYEDVPYLGSNGVENYRMVAKTNYLW